MAIQLGTVAPLGFGDFPPGPWLECFRQLGCTVVQAYRNPQANLSVSQMRDALAQGQMPCDSLHGIFGEEFDPSCPDESVRRTAMETYKAEGELAMALGGSIVVVHCSTIRRDGVPATERALRVRQLRKSIVDLGRWGQSAGVTYAFENLPSYHVIGADVAELAGMLSELAAPATGLCFDTGHANMVGDPLAAMAQAGDSLIYVHLSDNTGGADDHLMPTCGTLDIDAIARQLHAMHYDGTIMLEVFYKIEQLRPLMDAGLGAKLARMIDIANGKA